MDGGITDKEIYHLEEVTIWHMYTWMQSTGKLSINTSPYLQMSHIVTSGGATPSHGTVTSGKVAVDGETVTS